jgi:hypothetical protein
MPQSGLWRKMARTLVLGFGWFSSCSANGKDERDAAEAGDVIAP